MVSIDQRSNSDVGVEAGRCVLMPASLTYDLGLRLDVPHLFLHL